MYRHSNLAFGGSGGAEESLRGNCEVSKQMSVSRVPLMKWILPRINLSFCPIVPYSTAADEAGDEEE